MFEDTNLVDKDEEEQQDLIQELRALREDTELIDISAEQMNKEFELFTL